MEDQSEAKDTCNNNIGPDDALDDTTLENKILTWAHIIKTNATLVTKPSPIREEPYKNIYQAIQAVIPVQKDIMNILQWYNSNPVMKFRLQFLHIHALSSLGKWYEQGEEYAESEKSHKQCLSSIQIMIQNSESSNIDEIQAGVKRCYFMSVYEYTRFAIVCSERDKQSEALELLVKAEELYHKVKEDSEDPIPVEKYPTLALLDSLNSETLHEMFTYVLFYLGQAYKISGEKEKAILYLHMVLRTELEKEDVKYIQWAADASKMASVIVVNMDCFEAACNVLLAATAVINKCSEEEKLTDNFKQNYAELGRCWTKLGNEILEASCDRLRDLEEQTRPKKCFLQNMTLTSSEIQSLGITSVQEEYDTVLLVKSLHFPGLDLTEVREKEMKGTFVRDFDEARRIFLPLQKWINVAKTYYALDEFASDYIDIVTDYSNAYKHIAFFEPSLERQIKMHKRRIIILDELLANLNPKIYDDVFHFCLRELATVNETIYALKVSECKEKGQSLRPKDDKLVKYLQNSIGCHRRNLDNFKFDMSDPAKTFDNDYEKALLGSVLSIGRILGSISHDHPLHAESLNYAVEAKKYYEYFLKYLEHHEELKSKDFHVLYEGTRDMPELMDEQIRKLKHARSR